MEEIKIRIFRISGWIILSAFFFTVMTGSVSSVLARQGGIEVGQQVEVVTVDQNLNLRERPGTASPIIARLPPGTLMTVIGGPQEADGYIWWELEGPSGKGWAVESFLRPLAGLPSASGDASAVGNNCENPIQVHPGITHCTRAANTTQVILIDLNDPHVRFEMVMASDETNVNTTSVEWVSEMVKRYPGVVAAINADYFGAGHHGPEGLAIKNGKRFDGIANRDNDNGAVNRSSLVIAKTPFDGGGLPILADVSRLENDKQALDFNRFYNAVGGGPQVIYDGVWKWERRLNDEAIQCQTTNPDDKINGECFLNSGHWDLAGTLWTAVGITQDNHMVWLLGDYPSIQPAFEAFKTKEAIKLDGGGSSQLWLAGKPIIQGKRQVPNSLFVFYLHAFQVVQAPKWPVIIAGESLDVSLTLKNAGSDTWTTDGYSLIQKSQEDGPLEINLLQNVNPGEETTFNWTLQPGISWGIHTTEWQMTYDGKEFPDSTIKVRVIVLPEELEKKKVELERKIEEWIAQGKQEIERLVLQWINDQLNNICNMILLPLMGLALFVGINALHISSILFLLRE